MAVDIKNRWKDYEEAVLYINTDPLLAKDKFEKYIKEYPQHYFAHVNYAKALVTLSEFDAAEDVLKNLNTIYTSDKTFVNNETIQVDINLTLLRILCYKEMYKEFLDLFNKQQASLMGKVPAAAVFYCQNKVKPMSFEQRDKEKLYLYKQIICYMKDDFNSHVKEHLSDYYSNPRQTDKSIFSPGFPLNRVIGELKKYIPSSKRLCTGYYTDTYVFKYDNCGFRYGEPVSYFKVICFHDTKHIITMYPSEDCQCLPSEDLSYIIKENKAYDFIARGKQKHVSWGDLVLIDGQRYLVRKVFDKNKYSLLKVVTRDEGEISFVFNRRYFNVLKDAVVCETNKVRVLERYGERIIGEFEKAKKNSKKSR